MAASDSRHSLKEVGRFMGAGGGSGILKKRKRREKIRRLGERAERPGR